jgi:hypothetical protein
VCFVGFKREKYGGVMLHTLVTEEFTRNVQGFTSNDNDLLTVEGLLGNNRGESTQQVTLTVNHNSLFSNKEISVNDKET